MKSKQILPAVLVVVLVLIALVGVSCNKATGGGWFMSYDPYDGANIQVTFGFNAQPTNNDTAKGQFQLVARHLDGTVTIVHGMFNGTSSETDPNGAWFWGPCAVNGTEGYQFGAAFQDLGEPGPSKGDWITVDIYVSDPESPLYYWDGPLGGGNIQVFKTK